MSEIPDFGLDQINDDADRFERSWKKGTRPRIEDYLAEVDEGQRQRLLKSSSASSSNCAAVMARSRNPMITDADFRRSRDDRRRLRSAPRRRRDGRLGRAAESGPIVTKPIPPELERNPDYEIIRSLGGGGMGLVFLAHNQIMDRDEVLKIISPEIIDSPDSLERFLREIRVVPAWSIPTS